MPIDLVGSQLLRSILDHIDMGVLVVDREFTVVMWNRFLALNSGRPAASVEGRDLFACFPDLPQGWLSKKIQNVFLLGNYSFSCWEQRPFLFPFPHHRPMTSELDFMRQNSTFIPLRDDQGHIPYVCITLTDVTDASLNQEALREMSSRDGLTGAFNRGYLDEVLEREVARVRRYGGDLSLVLFDLDHFKSVNDHHGHLAGDEVLRQTSRRVLDCVRQPDLVARYGGEEFAILLPDTNLNGAMLLAERLRSLLAQPVGFEGFEIPISVSLGVTQWKPPHQARAMLEAADAALYQSKQAGRNRANLKLLD